MNTRMTGRLAFAAACGLGVSLAQAAEVTKVVSPEDMRERIVVQDVRVDGTKVSGTIVNKTGRLIENPQLVVRHNWIWNNEYRPGPDSPGWADFTTVPETLQPHQSAEFTIDASRSAPARDDGYIVTWADVMEIVAVK